jgi:hypothetical protein
MDAFEIVVATLLRQDGYWTFPRFKVELDPEAKRQIGRATTPRWEMDIVAYKGATNELLAVECKSFLNSRGVVFRDGKFAAPKRHKLFTEPASWKKVSEQMVRQLEGTGACPPGCTARLALAAGKFAKRTDVEELRAHFESNQWKLFDPDWIREKLKAIVRTPYENDVVHMVAKLLLRGRL